MTRSAARLALILTVGLGGCRNDKSAQPPTATGPAPVAPANPGIAAAALRNHVTFLADDAQEGRAPGTEADGRVQDYVQEALETAGFGPGFGGQYRQQFTVTDGVRLSEGGAAGLTVGKKEVPTALVPFSSDTGSRGPAIGKLIFVGYGIAGEEGKGGDYAGLDKKIAGKIVVAMHGGPNDPHLAPLKRRPQSKLIAARDRGAAGFVLWDPIASIPLPNHGEANDLQLPAIFAGAEANAALLAAFGAEAAEKVDPNAIGIRPGKTSRAKATLNAEVERVELGTANIAGLLPGNGESDKIIVVGAHMDHLGHGRATSLAPGVRAIHNGADDNASGVAVMLELCGAYARRPVAERRYGLLCAAFGAEEMGLLGSKYMVEQMGADQTSKIAAMINFDMVGRVRDNELAVGGVGTSSVWPDLVEASRGTLTVAGIEDGYGPSDHGSFYEAGIPVLHFFSGPHEDYHRPSDDIEKINFEGAAMVGDMALSVLTSVAAQHEAPDYKKTKRSTKASRRSFRVSLGTIPDYAAKVDGVRLSGVREGGAAAAAGLQKGDVIKKIGARDIHNLDDYMATFGELVPAEPVDFVIERDGANKTIAVTPAAPRPH